MNRRLRRLAVSVALAAVGLAASGALVAGRLPFPHKY